MDVKQFKQVVEELATSFQGKKVGKKYVWLYDELGIFLDTQRSEFKTKTFFINVSYFIKSISGLPDIESSEYLGDIVYRFSASFSGEYSDVFAIEELQTDDDVRNTLEREFNYFIKDIKTVTDIKRVISDRPNVRPFMKLKAEEYFGITRPKKKLFFGLFRL